MSATSGVVHWPLYTRQGEPIEHVDPHGEYVGFNSSPRYRVDSEASDR